MRTGIAVAIRNALPALDERRNGASCAGCGAAVLTEYRPALPDLFPVRPIRGDG
jgi:hypothetical protein